MFHVYTQTKSEGLKLVHSAPRFSACMDWAKENFHGVSFGGDNDKKKQDRVYLLDKNNHQFGYIV